MLLLQPVRLFRRAVSSSAAAVVNVATNETALCQAQELQAQAGETGHCSQHLDRQSLSVHHPTLAVSCPVTAFSFRV